MVTVNESRRPTRFRIVHPALIFSPDLNHPALTHQRGEEIGKKNESEISSSSTNNVDE
jgi:hypothetical protein